MTHSAASPREVSEWLLQPCNIIRFSDSEPDYRLINFQNVPPIRSKVPQSKAGSGDGPTKPKRISAYDYSAWDTFNVEKELEKLDSSEQADTKDSKVEDVEPMQDIQQNMDLAYREKAKGNEFVKQQNWVEGIKSYTNAINNFQSDPIFYANRALCYLKLNQ